MHQGAKYRTSEVQLILHFQGSFSLMAVYWFANHRPWIQIEPSAWLLGFILNSCFIHTALRFCTGFLTIIYKLCESILKLIQTLIVFFFCLMQNKHEV